MNSFRVLWRRKVLTFVLLILTLGGVAYEGVRLPWSYSASVTETLLDSQQSSKALGGGNPFLSFNAPMVEMANLLTIKLSDSANTLALQKDGYTASFEAVVLSENPDTEEPFIQISVKGGSKKAVAKTVQGIAVNLNDLLRQLQANVPVHSRLALQRIAETASPVRSWSAKIKPVAGFLGVGLLLTFLIPQAVEGSVVRRRKNAAGPVGELPGTPDVDRGGEPDQAQADQPDPVYGGRSLGGGGRHSENGHRSLFPVRYLPGRQHECETTGRALATAYGRDLCHPAPDGRNSDRL